MSINKNKATPAHDAIMLWLDANITQIVSNFIPLNRWNPEKVLLLEREAREAVAETKIKLNRELDLARQSIDALELDIASKAPKVSLEDKISYFSSEKNLQEERKKFRKLEAYIEKLENWKGLGLFPDETITVIEKIWERSVTKGKSNHIDCYIDMEAKVKVSYATCGGFVRISREGDLSDLIDDNLLPEWYTYGPQFSLFFEVKSSIESLGEVIRQIRKYKTYCPGKYIVVSPDDRYADLLKAQNIDFYKCTCELPKTKKQFDFFEQ
jgi:DNA-binding XRE family transcriptional regulator